MFFKLYTFIYEFLPLVPVPHISPSSNTPQEHVRQRVSLRIAHRLRLFHIVRRRWRARLPCYGMSSDGLTYKKSWCLHPPSLMGQYSRWLVPRLRNEPPTGAHPTPIPLLSSTPSPNWPRGEARTARDPAVESGVLYWYMISHAG